MLQSVSQFDLEWENIQTAQQWTALKAGINLQAASLCNRFPDAGINLLEIRLHPYDRIRWLKAGLNAARRMNDKYAESAHLGNLGMASLELAQYDDAIHCHEQSLTLDRELENSNGVAEDLNYLGTIYYYLGQYTHAHDLFEQALATFAEIGDEQGQGIVLNSIGNLAYSQGNL